MLTNSPVFPSIRVENLKKARDFYENKLGLKVIYEKPGELLMRAGKNSRIYLFKGKKSVAENTVAVFYVKDIYSMAKALAKKGVNFEHFDMPGFKTDEWGVVDHGNGKKGAWIKDPEGHVLGLSQIK